MFARSLLAEFAARIPQIVDRRHLLEGLTDSHVGERSLMDVFGTGTGFPLCDELVADWLSLWIRVAVIFNSPFNLMSALNPPLLGDAFVTKAISHPNFIGLEGCDGVGKATLHLRIARELCQTGSELIEIGQYSW